MWYISAMAYYSAIKKNEIMPFAAAWMDLEIFILSELSQTKTNTAYMWTLKMIQMNLCTKKQNYRHREQIYGYESGKGVESKLGVWD